MQFQPPNFQSQVDRTSAVGTFTATANSYLDCAFLRTQRAEFCDGLPEFDAVSGQALHANCLTGFSASLDNCVRAVDQGSVPYKVSYSFDGHPAAKPLTLNHWGFPDSEQAQNRVVDNAAFDAAAAPRWESVKDIPGLVSYSFLMPWQEGWAEQSNIVIPGVQKSNWGTEKAVFIQCAGFANGGIQNMATHNCPFRAKERNEFYYDPAKKSQGLYALLGYDGLCYSRMDTGESLGKPQRVIPLQSEDKMRQSLTRIIPIVLPKAENTIYVSVPGGETPFKSCIKFTNVKYFQIKNVMSNTCMAAKGLDGLIMWEPCKSTFNDKFASKQAWAIGNPVPALEKANPKSIANCLV